MNEIKVTTETVKAWEKTMQYIVDNRPTFEQAINNGQEVGLKAASGQYFRLLTKGDISWLIGAISHKLLEFEQQQYYSEIIKTPAPFRYQGLPTPPSQQRIQSWKDQTRSGCARLNKPSVLVRILDRIFGVA